MISKNIRYLLWNRGVWRFFHDTYLTIEVQGIRCTNHLHDFCPLTDVNPHFTAPGCRYYFKINTWWSIVTSSTHGPAASYCDVTMAHCSHGYLSTHGVEVGASWRNCDNLSCLAHDFITLHIVVEWFITAHWETKQFNTRFGLFFLLYLSFSDSRVSTRGMASILNLPLILA